MHIEIEERILDIDSEKVIKKLEELNAIKVGEWYQKRYVYDFNPKRENEWIRKHNNKKNKKPNNNKNNEKHNENKKEDKNKKPYKKDQPNNNNNNKKPNKPKKEQPKKKEDK